MGVLSSLVLALVGATGSPAPLASTYDEAACAEPAPVPKPPGECHEPPVIACEQVSAWASEMIGACMDARPVEAPAAVLAKQNSKPRPAACDGLSCQNDSVPLRPGTSSPYQQAPFLVSRFEFATPLFPSRHLLETLRREHQSDRDRIERPPRVV